MARLTNQQLHEELIAIKADVKEIKVRLLDPDNGTISRVNKNTSFRKGAQKTLWSIWVVLVGILGKLIFWNQENKMPESNLEKQAPTLNKMKETSLESQSLPTLNTPSSNGLMSQNLPKTNAFNPRSITTYKSKFGPA